MKLKVGTKLRSIRETKNLKQEQMASILNMAESTYGRYERNETQMDMDTLTKVSEILNIPLQDFFPETFHINSTNNGNGQAGLVMGNYSYYGIDESSKELIKQNMLLKKEIEELKDELKQRDTYSSEFVKMKKEFEELRKSFHTGK